MLRSSLIAASSVILCASATAQQGATVQSVPGAVKDAGIYHVATGTWTRNSSATANLGPDTIYRNDSQSGYFSTLNMAAAAGDWSIIDSGRIPTTGSGIAGADRTEYTVNCLQVGYCSGVVGPNTAVTFNLYESYSPCDLIVTAPVNPFTLSGSVAATGLPGGSTAGAACWIVTVDFSGGGEFCLEGDGGSDNPGEDFDTSTDSFGMEWIFNGAAGTSTGPLLTGDPTWNFAVGGSITGVGGGGCYYSPAGSDGVCMEGTGLDTTDFFAVDGVNAGLGPNCYWFGGYKNTNGCALSTNTPFASWYMTVFADAGDCTGGNSTFCEPAGNNSSGGPVSLASSASGTSPSGQHLDASGGPDGQFGYFLVGGGNAGNVPVGDGVLCLQQFGRYSPSEGPALSSIGSFAGGGVFTSINNNGGGTGFDIPATLPSAQSGAAIMAGDTWHFQLWYRDVNPTQTSNLSNGETINF